MRDEGRFCNTNRIWLDHVSRKCFAQLDYVLTGKATNECMRYLFPTAKKEEKPVMCILKLSACVCKSEMWQVVDWRLLCAGHRCRLCGPTATVYEDCSTPLLCEYSCGIEPQFTIQVSRDSSVVRVIDLWLKGLGFETQQEWQGNFLLLGKLSALTYFDIHSTPVLLQ